MSTGAPNQKARSPVYSIGFAQARTQFFLLPDARLRVTMFSGNGSMRPDPRKQATRHPKGFVFCLLKGCPWDPTERLPGSANSHLLIVGTALVCIFSSTVSLHRHSHGYQGLIPRLRTDARTTSGGSGHDFQRSCASGYS